MIAENYAFQNKEEIKKNITIGYYTEYFARNKKLPKLSKVLREIDKPKSIVNKGDLILKAMAKEKGVKI